MSETVDLLLRGARLPDRESLVDIAVTGDRIVGIDPVARPARETLDLGGRLVTPGLVEAHIHLDKALLSDRVTAPALWPIRQLMPDLGGVDLSPVLAIVILMTARYAIALYVVPKLA